MAKRSSLEKAGRASAPTRLRSRADAGSRPAQRSGVSAWLDSRVGFTVAVSLVVLVALGARLATWEWIFGSGRVELVPADSHYYVRLARLHLAAGGPVPFDPFVAFPLGSENYWPPVHTLLVSLAALGADPEVGVAFVGPVATLLWLGALAWAMRRIAGARATLVCVFLLALLPIVVESGKIGNADHNVHEPPIAALVLLLGLAAVRGSSRAAVGAGLAAGAARLLTTTGFVFPGVLAGAYAVAALFASGPARSGLTRRIALSGGVCVGTLALAVIALGHPGRLDYEALTLFHPLLSCSLFGVAVALSAWLEGRRRFVLAGGACALVGLAALPGLLRAAGHLARQDPLLAVVAESRPLAGDPVLALALFGPALVALPLAILAGARQLRSRPEIAVPTVGTLVFLAGAAAQARMGTFLAGAAAVLIPLALGRAIGELAPGTARAAKVVAGLGLSPLLLLLVPADPPGTPAPAALIRPTLIWMRGNLPPAAADPWDYRATPTYGVLAPYDYGHFITLYAERPVLASTFSQTDEHVEANRVAAEILSEPDEERAYRRARDLRLAYVLAAPSELFGAGPLPPDALLARLLRRDSFGHFRPLHVSEERRAGGGRFATVFEVVEGASIAGPAPAGTTVEARLEDGYARAAVADPAGRFTLRVARPGTYLLSAGGVAGRIVIGEDEVRSGATVSVGTGG